jgi:hypothetical protein
VNTEITVKNRAGVPAIAEPERIEREIATLSEFIGPLYAGAVFEPDHDTRVALSHAEKWLESGASATLKRQLDEFDKPATRDAVASELLLLTCAFPNVAARDLKMFGKLLLEDVAAAAPSRLALHLACRRVRRTSRHLPVIAEILAVLNEERLKIQHARSRIQNLPHLITDVRRKVDKDAASKRWYEERYRRQEEQYQARQQKKIEERQP